MYDRNPVRLKERPSEGLALLEYFVRLHTSDTPLHTLLWSRVRARKDFRCYMCGKAITAGKGMEAYRPMTNGDERGDRICVPCIEGDRNAEAE